MDLLLFFLNLVIVFIIPGGLIVYLFKLEDSIFKKVIIGIFLSISVSVIIGVILAFFKSFTFFNLYIMILLFCFLLIISAKYLRTRVFKITL